MNTYKIKLNTVTVIEDLIEAPCVNDALDIMRSRYSSRTHHLISCEQILEQLRAEELMEGDTVLFEDERCTVMAHMRLCNGAMLFITNNVSIPTYECSPKEFISVL